MKKGADSEKGINNVIPKKRWGGCCEWQQTEPRFETDLDFADGMQFRGDIADA